MAARSRVAPISPQRYGAILRAARSEFRKGRIVEVELRSEGEVLEGCEEHGWVYIDPAAAIVETLIHELLHRRYPKWTEREVSDRAYAVTTLMPPEERRAWYVEYKRAAVRRTTPLELDDDDLDDQTGTFTR